MFQERLFLCTTCGGDQLRNPHDHTAPPTRKHLCPICKLPKLDTQDPNHSEWVALGEAVCSRQCHEEAYDLVRHVQYELLPAPP